MTRTNPIDAVRTLLEEAEAAHGVYETTELHGVYDEAWPAWYAQYAVEHGIGDLLGHAVPTKTLADLLDRAFKDFKDTAATTSEPWATYMARRITAEL